MEREIRRVEFTFDNGSKRVLEDEELRAWIGICYMQSDYLLPGASDHVLATMYGGLVQGFVPASRVTA